MMKYAYDPEYLPLTQRVMGDMYDYAVNTLGFPIEEYHKMFLVSNMSHQFEIANPTFVAGKNGCEVAKAVVQKCMGYTPEEEDVMYLDKSIEYWIGWSLAYYQWISSRDYQSINKQTPIVDLYAMYDTFHEADISKFVSVMDEKCSKSMDESKLKRLRMYAKLTQRQLAEKSGVPIRQIQLFEQGYRDINKTQASTVIQLSQALHCECRDLIM